MRTWNLLTTLTHLNTALSRNTTGSTDQPVQLPKLKVKTSILFFFFFKNNYLSYFVLVTER